jgi:endonuclease/exonuclease/phosphatase family metal-dependent hydrolase
MRWFLILLVAHAGFAAPITLVSWNLQNYLSMDRRTEGVFRPDYPKPEDEKDGLRSTLYGLLPDILLIQEIGPEPYLIELQHDLAVGGLHLPHRAHAGGDDDLRFLAILSRWPIRSARNLVPNVSVEGSPLSSKNRRRGLLIALIDTPHGPLCVVTLHFKSRRTTDPDDPNATRWRLAEARAARDALISAPETQGNPLIIAGDFNAGINSPELQAFSVRGTRRIWQRAPATDRHGEVWTYRSLRTGDYSTLDHLLTTPSSSLLIRAWIPTPSSGPNSTPPSDHRPLAAWLALD